MGPRTRLRGVSRRLGEHRQRGLRSELRDDQCAGPDASHGKRAYCGENATSRDHFPPQTVADRLGYAMQTVPACMECNVLLGARPPWFSVRSRRRYIGWLLKKRYRKLLETPTWSDTELQKLGRGLRKYVESRIAQKQRVGTRIQWAFAGSVTHAFLPRTITRNGALGSAAK
jgi:hypothetical protein